MGPLTFLVPTHSSCQNSLAEIFFGGYDINYDCHSILLFKFVLKLPMHTSPGTTDAYSEVTYTPMIDMLTQV